MVTISLEGVTVSLNTRKVLSKVSADLTAGTLIGIIGPNGAGKSTLVRAMLGLVPVSTGQVVVDDAPIASILPKALARKLAYLPQGQTVHWPLTVERLIALGRLPYLSPFSRIGPSDADAIEHAIARADVGHLRQRDATQLSGGERARALLARALAVGATGLIVDEPLASLDPGHQIDVMEILAGEARKGSLVLAVLHDLTLAARYCDRLIVMDQGKLVADGTPVEVLTADLLRSVYGVEAFVDRTSDALMVIPMRRTAL
jgi:iron complex transport system ATP-binding protein